MTFLERQLEDPVRFAKIKRWFYLGLIVLVLFEIFLPLVLHMVGINFHSHQPHFWFENFPAADLSPKLPWGSIYGLISCMAIIIISKFIGKVWLMRREDYYDR